MSTYSLSQRTMSEIARALHDGGRIGVEELHAPGAGSEILARVPGR